MSVKFENTDKDNSFEMKNPSRQDVLSLDLGQVITWTADGQPLAYELGTTRKRIRVRFDDVRDCDKDRVDAWFETEVEGAKTTFHYRDHEGTWWDARFLQSALEWTCLGDATASVGTYSVGSEIFPTTKREAAYWSVEVQLWLTTYTG